MIDGLYTLIDDTTFNGVLLGECSTETGNKSRWTEVRIFWNDDSDAYVAEVLGCSDFEDEETRGTVYFGEEPDDIVNALQYGGKISWPAAEALAEAAGNDVALRAALS